MPLGKLACLRAPVYLFEVHPQDVFEAGKSKSHTLPSTEFQKAPAVLPSDTIAKNPVGRPSRVSESGEKNAERDKYK